MRNFRIGRKSGDDVEGRFWEKVDKQGPDECWEWQAAKLSAKAPYGILRVGSLSVRAHRLSYELHYGKIPDGLFVCHKCDNPPCVNPNHLFLGTEADNVHDAIQKTRFSMPPKNLGEKHPRSILTIETVRQIRRWRLEGVSHNEIAKRLGVNKSTVKDVVQGRTWSHID